MPLGYTTASERGSVLVHWLLAVFCIVVIVSIGGVYYRVVPLEPLPLFSAHRTLADLWSSYKRMYLEAGTGRTLNPLGSDDATTAQYEAVTMLQAVWMDDKATFDQSWQWVKDNLQHQTSKLIAARFGKLPGGNYGLQSREADSDAQTSIAVALIEAYTRWNFSGYAYDSLPLIRALWRDNVGKVDGNLVVVRRTGKQQQVEPASLQPFAYKKFAYIDRAHDWLAVETGSYAFLKSWAAGQRSGTLDSRVLWNLALSWQWDHDERAYALLRQAPRDVSRQSPSHWAHELAYLRTLDSPEAARIYQTQLVVLYDPVKQGLYRQRGPYEDGWVWLGIALYNGRFFDMAPASIRNVYVFRVRDNDVLRRATYAANPA